MLIGKDIKVAVLWHIPTLSGLTEKNREYLTQDNQSLCSNLNPEPPGAVVLTTILQHLAHGLEQ
jgi:hypothetical protein